MPWAAAPAENSPASSLSENRAQTSGSFAADLGLLEDVPSFGIDQLEEGWAGEVVEGQFAVRSHP